MKVELKEWLNSINFTKTNLTDEDRYSLHHKLDTIKAVKL